MADDNRFSGIGDKLDEENGEREADEEPQAPEANEPADPPEPPEEHDPKTDRAFEFDEARQSAVYPREEVWEDFEDVLEWEVRQDIVRSGYENVSKSELHEAAIRVLAQNPDLIVEEFEDLRENAE